MSKRILTILLVLCTGLLLAQKKKKAPGYKEYFLEGSYLLLEDEPEKALRNFKMAYQIDSGSANINYMMGICCLLTATHKAEAEYYLQKSVGTISGKYKSDTYKEKSAPPLSHFYYGKALHFNYKFEEAMKEFEAFKPSVNPKDLEYVKMLAFEELKTTTARNITNFPLNVKIINLGDSINSVYPEYSPVFSGDERTLIYTTRRPQFSTIKDEDGNCYEDIVISFKDENGVWSSPVGLGLNTIGHEACLNLTPDGQTLLVFRNEGVDFGNGNIYYAKFDGRGFSTLEDFGSDINSPYLESHACLSADGNVLYFSSDRPGGYGGRDLYRCVKLPNGKWSKALNMGPRINTEYDEDGGFIHPDGQTFYYASNGPGTIGGYDVFYATLNEENRFDNPTNIGYPVNTTDDDIFYVVSPDGKRAYFASAKETGKGEKDIYQIQLEEKREIFLALFKGQILPAEGDSLPDNIVIIVTDKDNGETVGTYRPRLQNGSFSTILPPGKTYAFSYQINNGEEFYNEEVYVSNEYAYQEYNREVELEPVRIGSRPKVVKNVVEMQVQVLQSVLDKTPVPQSKITLYELGKSTTKRVYTANDQGLSEIALLALEKSYKIIAESNGKKSDTVVISTKGLKTAERLLELVYLKKEAPLLPSKYHTLDLLVKHSKSKKAIGTVTLTLTDEEGRKSTLLSDNSGKLKNIALIPGMKYKILAFKDAYASEEEVVIAPEKAGKLSKTILLAYNSPTLNLANERDSTGKRIVIADQYAYYYTYGKFDIDVKSIQFTDFVNEIIARKKDQSTVTITITGSASKVPMRANGGNPALAQRRADGLKDLIVKELANRGITLEGISFQVEAVVGGPDYQNDYIANKRVYQKHQFAKARVR